MRGGCRLKDTSKREPSVLYVYDRVCPKKSKRKELLREYGTPSSHSGASTFSGEPFAARQRARAKQFSEANPYFDTRKAAYEDVRRQRDASRAYNYGHASSRAARGGYEAVRRKKRPLKIVLDRIINLFDTIEERSRADEQIAKQRAISRKKFYDHKNGIITALLVILIFSLFVFSVFRFFFVIESVSASGGEIYSEGEILSSAGIYVGDNLYAFDKDRAEADITFRCPYIKTADITRTPPKTVSVTVTEDSAMYFARIWDDCVVLSPGLRVLEKTTKADAREAGLVELVLPPVSYSVEGRTIEFLSARDERFIREILTDVAEAELYSSGMIDKIDLSDEFSVSMQISSKYLFKMGGEEDFDLKLKMGYKTIIDLQTESNSPARVDLTVVGEASVRLDMKLELEP